MSNPRESYDREKQPAALLYYEGLTKPRQYVIFRRAVIKGQCGMEVLTTSSLQLTYPFLSEEQCEIYRENGTWYYKNLTDDTFTFVGGKLIKKDEIAELADGTMIRVVNNRMLTMIFLSEMQTGRDWQVINMDDGRHEVRIRNRKAGQEQDALVLEYAEGKWTLKEMQGARVLINGKESDNSAKIRIDDCIDIDDTRFFFEGAGLIYGYPTQGNALSIKIDERSAHKAMKKITLLKDINLQVDPGNMVLILGGSGAGKSTFVNAVTGYEKAKATIQEGNLDYYRDYGQVKHRIGFVPQENLMREDDTVGDTVMNAADMRLPDDMPQKEKEERVAAVLETFGLTGREKELVSKLSGGQKKRLSICTEFVASPSLFILDEPDSGLDGIMATELMENLRMIACQGRIVMVITHSPDRVAHLFDKVIVLAKGTETKIGQLAFYGGIQEARDFFGVPTMEDVVKRINAVNEGGEGRSDEYIEKFKIYQQEHAAEEEALYLDADQEEEAAEQKTTGGEKSAIAGTGKTVRYKNRLQQIPVYLGKQFRLLFTEMNWKVLPMAAIIAYLVVYVLGSKMFRNMEYTKYGSLALICVCIWNGMFNSIQVVCKERSIIKREHRAGLHISSYLAAHMIYQAIICLVQVVITLVIFRVFGMFFPNTGLLTGSFTIDVAISMFLATYASDMLALMVSCIVHTTTTAMTVMPFLLIVQLVFAGSIFPLNRPMAKTIANFTISNWGINAINIAADYNGQQSTVLYTALGSMSGEGDELMEKVHDVMEIPEVKTKVQTYTAEKLQVKAYEYDKMNLLKCWGILLAFSFLYVLIGLLFLEQIDYDKR